MIFTIAVCAACSAAETAPDRNKSLLKDEAEIVTATEMAPIPAIPPAVILAASLPDAPQPRPKVVDKKFIAVMAALGGAETLRLTTHKLVLDHEFAAGAPWVTSTPGNGGMIARNAAIFAAELLVAYELKKPHSWLPGDKYIRKLWWVYPATMTTIHIKNGIGSIRTKAPTECPPELCGD
jgi:hypothetical protein